MKNSEPDYQKILVKRFPWARYLSPEIQNSIVRLLPDSMFSIEKELANRRVRSIKSFFLLMLALAGFAGCFITKDILPLACTALVVVLAWVAGDFVLKKMNWLQAPRMMDADWEKINKVEVLLDAIKNVTEGQSVKVIEEVIVLLRAAITGKMAHHYLLERDRQVVLAKQTHALHRLTHPLLLLVGEKKQREILEEIKEDLGRAFGVKDRVEMVA